MLEYHNDPSIKEKYLSRVRAHREADEIIKGVYWEKGKGCAVGCTIHGNDHSKYETELGIPIVLAVLEDNIFENIPNERAKIWHEEFISAINFGADLSGIWPKFVIWLLTDEKYGVLQYAKTDELRKTIQAVSDYYSRYKEITLSQWQEIYNIAYACDAAAVAVAVAVTAVAVTVAYAAGYSANAHADLCADTTKIRLAQADKLLELLREAK